LESRAIVGRSLDVPLLDGATDDPAYGRGEQVTLLGNNENAGVKASLVHSGTDLYISFQNIPLRQATRVIVRVDTNHIRGATLAPGDYEFELGANGGATAREADPSGVMRPLEISAEDFTGKVRSDGDGWSAELRINLDWLGGFGRTDGLALAVERENESAGLHWPKKAEARQPGSWGEIVLAPTPPESVVAGSVFLDGRGGHLVVPYSPGLNPRELTIEAWTRVVDGGGTLISNGRGRSYWIGLGDELKFSSGAGFLNSSTRKLGNIWHHLAVTMDERGARTFYIDGEIDRQLGGGEKEDEREKKLAGAAKLGVSDKMLLLGSDREAVGGEKNFHGYLRDLRIWNRVRTRKEIRDAAFQRLTGHESGLVGLWPFTNGLQDLVSGHHAGFVGNASLAREKPTIEKFPGTPAAPPLTFSKPEPKKPWDGAIPLIRTEVKIDGVGNAAEWNGAAKIPLEPERKNSMRIAQTPAGLVLFTGILLGQPNGHDGVTICLSGEGEGRETSGPTDVRIHFSPDGKVDLAVGDGHDFQSAPVTDITTRTISGPVFAAQEDIGAIKTPWWAMEVQIPWKALRMAAPPKQLRFGIEYQGSVLESAVPPNSPKQKMEGRWPADFDPIKLRTLGVVKITPEIVRAPGPQITASVAPAGGTHVLKADASPPPAASPSVTPTLTMLSQFAMYCPESLLDGIGYATDTETKWPHVDLPDHRFVTAEGRISEKISAKVSDNDSPLIHDSHDIDTKIDVMPEFAWLVLGAEEGNRELVLETESMRFPTHAPLTNGDAFYYRPWNDDHVTVAGEWVFDCGHSAKTEIHPIYMIESDHVEILPVRPGKPMERVRVVRVSMNSDPGARSALLGNFSFSVDRPSSGTKDFLKVRNGDPNLVAATVNGSKIDFVVTPPAPTGEYHFEFELGSLDGTPLFATYLYEVRIANVIVKDDSDAGLNGSGEWYMAAGVNGHWRQLFWNRSVTDGEKVTFDNDFNLRRYFTAGDPATGLSNLVLEVTAYEEDSVLAESASGINGSTDDALSSDRWDLGPLATLSQGTGWHTLETPSWTITYEVGDITHRNAIIFPILADELFWDSRLANEPNDSASSATKIGPLEIPPTGEATSQLEGSLTGAPLSLPDGVRLLTPDEDWYLLTFSDFADVTAEVSAGQVSVDPLPISELAPELAAKLGTKKYEFRIFGNDSASGDESYSVTLHRKAKVIEPDPGEADDENGGRLVDLTQVPPTNVTAAKKTVTGERRDQTKDWAWQHVVNDIDLYKVIVPAKSKQEFPTFCPFNKPARLTVSAYGMHLSIPARGLEGDNEIVLEPTDLGPATPLLVEVRAQSGQGRGYYRFNAEWVDALFLTEKECKIAGEVEKVRKRNPSFIPLPQNPWFYSGKGPNSPDPPMQEDVFAWSANTAHQEILLEEGAAIDSILFAESDQAVSARLYDESGVLLAESQPIDSSAAGALKGRSGLTPQARLQTDGLNAGSRYLLQLIPAGGNAVQQKVRVGIQAHTTN